TLYGEGFYYIPGTDICLKIGGFVPAHYPRNATGGGGPPFTPAGGAPGRSRAPHPHPHPPRAHLHIPPLTHLGALPPPLCRHIDNVDAGSVTVNPTRAFIQWAGFTFGHTKSFTDTPGTPGDDTFKSLFQTQNQSDTGANGTNQIAYTWELGNGMTLNVGADERRTKSITNLSSPTGAAVWTIGAQTTDFIHGEQYPNPWVNFAVNQAWGRFGISAVLNPIHSVYYGSGGGFPGYAPTAACVAQPNTTFCSYPEDDWGWAVFAGIDIKAPWLGPGDHFGGYAMYGQGALAYAGGSNLSNPSLFGGGNQLALGVITDAVFVNGSGFELTTAWTAGAGYEHFWLPNFSTTVYGTYTEVSYDDTVINSRWFCGTNGGATQNVIIPANVACDPGFKFWTIGTHTDWYPVPGFRLAV